MVQLPAPAPSLAPTTETTELMHLGMTFQTAALANRRENLDDHVVVVVVSERLGTVVEARNLKKCRFVSQKRRNRIFI